MKLVFWQPIPSFHQEAFLNALAVTDWVDSVQLYYEEELTQARIDDGWPLPNFQGVQARPISRGEVPSDEAEQAHFFTGFKTHPIVWQVFDRMRNVRQSACYALTEAPALYGWRRLPREILYRKRAISLSGRLDGLLAIGRKAEVFYQSILKGATPVYPFAYYDASNTNIPERPALERRDKVHLLYVGRLIHLKGIDRLLRACAKLTRVEPDWHLTILGDGPEEGHLKHLASKLGIGNYLEWKSALPAAEVSKIYHEADILIQPSRGDGWGMTVVEALRHGCEVIATHACGAAVAAHPSKRLSSNWRDWVSVLREQIQSGPLTDNQRAANQKRALAYCAEEGVARLKTIVEARPPDVRTR
ncbi:MAG: glycosyltransferase [Verrucomicrobiota bacterium]